MEERLLLLQELITDTVLSSYNFLEGLVREFDVIYTWLFCYNCIVSVVTFQFLLTLGKVHQLIHVKRSYFWSGNQTVYQVQCSNDGKLLGQ